MPTWRRELANVSDAIFIKSDFYTQYNGLLNDPKFNEFIEKNKISLERLILLNKVSEEEILHLLKKKEQEEKTQQSEKEAVSHEKNETII